MDETRDLHLREACGRCGSHELLEIPVTPGDHSHIVLGEHLLRTVAVTKYVCTDCGHVEEWVTGRDDLGRLKAEISRGHGPARVPRPAADGRTRE